MGKKKDELATFNDQAPAHIPQGRDGLENAGQADLLIPRLVIMQALTPAVQSGERFQGEVVNSLTGEVWIPKGGVELFIPVYHYKEWIQWAPRDSNQGIIGRSLDPGSELALSVARGEKNEVGRFVVTEYHNFIAVFADQGFAKPVIISCCRTNHKHARKLLGLASYRGQYPLFAGLYSVAAAQETNRSNQAYFAYKFENAGWVDEGQLAEAKHMYDTLKQMSWKAAEPVPEHAESEV